MTPLYIKAKRYNEMADKYWKAYKKLQEERGTTLRILPKDFTEELKKIYDATPDFHKHFEKDIYEPHGLFQATVGDVEIHILYGHEEIKVITPEKTFEESTR